MRARRALPADGRERALRAADRCAPRSVDRVDLVKIAPSARDLTGGLYEYHLDFPGDALSPGCGYEQLGPAHLGRPPADGLRARRDRARLPRPARAAVLVLLRLQRLEQPARRRLGDDPARLRRATPPKRWRSARPRSATASTRERSGRTGATTSSSSSTALIRSSSRRPARTRTSSATGCYLGSSASRASAATTRRGPHETLRPAVATIPSDPAAARAEFPWIDFQGRWGELQPAFFNGPTGPNLKTQWTQPITLVGGLARPELRRPGRQRFRDRGDRLLLPGDRQRVEGARPARPPSTPVHPGRGGAGAVVPLRPLAKRNSSTSAPFTRVTESGR